MSDGTVGLESAGDGNAELGFGDPYTGSGKGDGLSGELGGGFRFGGSEGDGFGGKNRPCKEVGGGVPVSVFASGSAAHDTCHQSCRHRLAQRPHAVNDKCQRIRNDTIGYGTVQLQMTGSL